MLSAGVRYLKNIKSVVHFENLFGALFDFHLNLSVAKDALDDGLGLREQRFLALEEDLLPVSAQGGVTETLGRPRLHEESVPFVLAPHAVNVVELGEDVFLRTSPARTQFTMRTRNLLVKCLVKVFATYVAHFFLIYLRFVALYFFT